MTAITPAAPAAPVAPAPPGALALGARRVQIELRQFFRDRQSAMFNFALPMLLMVIFGSVYGHQTLNGTSITFAQYFVPGMIASGVLYTSFQNLAIAIPLEREDGTLKRLRGTPMPKMAYFLGKIGLVFVAYVVQVALLVAIGRLAFHIVLPSGSQWVTFAWVSVLGLVACTLAGIAFSVVPRTAKGAPAIASVFVLVLQFTSGVFFPYNTLPNWMKVLASVFPLKWLTQAMRSVFLPSGPEQVAVMGHAELGKCAAVLLAWVVIGLVSSLVFFRWTARGDG